MDFQQLLEKYKPFLLQHWLPITLGCIGLLLIVYGLIASLGSSSSPDIVFEEGSEEEVKKLEMYVDVAGAVEKPGVYRLHGDARLKDALVAASGMSFEADREWVAKNLNLAAKLTDGGKIYVPRVGEGSRQKTEDGGGNVQGTSGGLININSASVNELDRLPGVGPVTARKIIEGRPYGSVEDLSTKKVVGNKVFSEIKDMVSVY